MEKVMDGKGRVGNGEQQKRGEIHKKKMSSKGERRTGNREMMNGKIRSERTIDT